MDTISLIALLTSLKKLLDKDMVDDAKELIDELLELSEVIKD